LLLALDRAWDEEAAAREEAAYTIGVIVGQTRPVCVDCDDERTGKADARWRRATAARASRRQHASAFLLIPSVNARPRRRTCSSGETTPLSPPCVAERDRELAS
jgi:hypothetical protein